MKATAIFHTGPEKVECREIRLAALHDGDVLIETIRSALSPGTESMIYRGHLPSGIPGDATIPSLSACLEYPFRYGYALIGEIIDHGKTVDPAWMGRRVFVFHPHQTRAVVPLIGCLPVPDELSIDDALFLPNMESALNFVMDADPSIGSRVMVFGLGVVGRMTCDLFARLPLARLIAADPLAGRRKRAADSGLTEVIDPADENQWQSLVRELFDEPCAEGVDIAVELSGNMEALNQAIEITGPHGTIVLGSWYGTRSRTVDLGGHFHRRRITILSSQVSTIQPRLSGRWTKERRIGLAWDMIRTIRPASLISHRFALHDCDRAFQIASRRLEDCFQIIFEYR